MDYIGTHQKAKEAQGNPFDFSDKLQMFATLRMQKNALEAEKMKTQAEGEQRLFENAMKLKQLDLDTSKQEFEQIGMVFDHLEQTKDVESTQQFADQLGLPITLKDLNPENNIVKFTSETGDPNNPYVLFEGRARDVAAASSMANALMAAGNPKEQAMLAAATKNGVSITAVKDPNKDGGGSGQEKYSIPQELDDLRGDVNIERAQYANEFGLPRPGMEKEYAEVEKRYAINRSLLQKGVRNPRQYERPIDAYQKLKDGEITKRDYDLILKTKFKDKVPIIEGSDEFIELIKTAKSPQDAERLANELGYIIVPKEQIDAANNIQSALDELVLK